MDKGDEKVGTRGKPIQSNLTDNDSANIATSLIMVQGYTGIAVADAKCQVIVHAEAHGSASEHLYLKGVLQGIRENMRQEQDQEDILFFNLHQFIGILLQGDAYEQ